MNARVGQVTRNGGCEVILASLFLMAGVVCAAEPRPETKAEPAKALPPVARSNQFDRGPKPGTAAPDFELKTVEGKSIRASTLWSNKPTVIMMGSHTCPIFRGKVNDFEGLVQEFSNKANFVVLYTIEAHPKGDPSPYKDREWVVPANEKIGLRVAQPKTMEERTARALTCAGAMKLTVSVVVDRMDNGAWKAYGSAPNSGFLIGSDGKVIEQEPWFDPPAMRAALKALTR